MRFVSAAFLTLAVTLTLAAAPPAPAIEVRLRGITDLLDRFEYLAKLVDQEDAGTQLVQTVQGFADPKTGLEGIDPARPVGLYATVAPNPVESRAVLLVPVADEEAFLGLLTGKLSLDPKKGDDGVYTVRVPSVPLPVYFRFADKTCYLTVGLPAAVEKGQVIGPKQFFADADPGVLSARVRLDRLPADLKKTALGQFELQLADAKTKNANNETPGQTALKGWALDRLAEAGAALFADGEELLVRLGVDPKADDLSFALSLSAKPNTPLAKTVGGLSASGRTTAAPLPPASDALATFGVTAALADKAKASLAKVVDQLLTEAVANTKEAERGPFKLIVNALAPTLKGGVLDLNVQVAPAGKPDRYRVLGAAAVVDGKRIEATVKQFAPFLPESQVRFAFDQGSAGGLTLHRATVGDAKYAAAFDTDAVWLATGDKRLAFGFEPAGEGVKQAAAAAPTPAPLAAGSLNVAKLLAVARGSLPEATVGRLVKQVFGGAVPSGGDVVGFRLEGGQALTLRVASKGKALQLGVLVDKERKKGQE